ncbi:hypothetical protein [uncultured Campylobacter sp.]
MESASSFGHEGGVNGTESFIKKEDFGFDGGDHTEGETDAHAG